jgi:hypothetical protein
VKPLSVCAGARGNRCVQPSDGDGTGPPGQVSRDRVRAHVVRGGPPASCASGRSTTQTKTLNPCSMARASQARVRRESILLVSPALYHTTQVTASNLLLVDKDGKVVEGEGAPEHTAFFIHSNLHMADPHNNICVLHTHQV